MPHFIVPWHPNTKFETADMQAAVDQFGYKLVIAGAGTASEVDAAFTLLVQRQIDALRRLPPMPFSWVIAATSLPN